MAHSGDDNLLLVRCKENGKAKQKGHLCISCIIKREITRSVTFDDTESTGYTFFVYYFDGLSLATHLSST